MAVVVAYFEILFLNLCGNRETNKKNLSQNNQYPSRALRASRESSVCDRTKYHNSDSWAHSQTSGKSFHKIHLTLTRITGASYEDRCTIAIIFHRNLLRVTNESDKRREEKPTRCHWMVYCTYNMLNMFRPLLCPSSGARDYMWVITACGVWCLGCWLLEVRCRAAGYAFGIRDVARLRQQSSNIPHPERIAGCLRPDLQQPATKASHTIGGSNTHIVSSSWWWA
jgi:hypothetical protein